MEADTVQIIQTKQTLVRTSLWVFILVLPFAVFYWLLPFAGELTIGNDYASFAIQHQLELQYSIERGSFPLYVPGFAGGRSAAALTMGQVFHPASHLSALMPGYWDGYALEWNTLWRLVQLGIAQLALLLLLLRLRLTLAVAFFLSFITVYNLRMLDLFRYGTSLENYAAYIFLGTAMGFYFLKPTKFLGPLAIIASTYLLISGGHPQMMYYGLLGAGIAALAIPFAFSAIRPDIELTRSRVLKFYSVAGICTIAGLLASFAYLAPFYFDYVADNTVRVGREYQWALAFSDTWGGALGSIFAPLKADVHGAFGSSPIIVLAALAPLVSLVGKRLPTIFLVLWGLAVLIFLCSVGDDTFIHKLFWEYFPFAQDFRTPGRINMVLPFIFLMILAWIFREEPRNNGSNEESKRAVPSGFILALLSLAVFFAFNWFLADKIPQPSHYIPAQILGSKYPDWANQTVFWSGFITLVLSAAYLTGTRYCAPMLRIGTGILLGTVIVAQVTIQIRYGTWIEEKNPTWTLEELNTWKEKTLGFHGAPGYGMESAEVIEQRERSFLETRLAKFYRKSISAVDQDNAYQLMAGERTPDAVVVEREITGKDEASEAGIDRVELIYSSFNKLIFRVEAGAPGYLVLSYPYSTKWGSSVDEQDARVYRANGNLMAVHMEKGTHTVNLKYFSKAAFLGIFISSLTILIVGLFFSLYVFQGPRRLLAAALSTGFSISIFLLWYLSLYGGENLKTNYHWDSADFPPNENLAYGRPTRMSSIWSTQLPYDYYAGLAVDGERNTYGFVTNRRDQGSWWQVDLGKSRPIGTIVIHAGPKGWLNLPLNILVSDDGKNYTLIRKLENASSRYPWQIPVQGVSARFVRLALARKGPMSLQEIEVYEPGYIPQL